MSFSLPMLIPMIIGVVGGVAGRRFFLFVQQIIAARAAKSQLEQHQQRLSERRDTLTPFMAAVELAYITTDDEMIRG